MHIRVLNQEQCRRMIKTSSNWLCKHAQSCRYHENMQEHEKDWRVREKIGSQDLYTGSLKPELHLVCQGNLSLTLHYFKRFTKYPPLHFQNMQKPQTRLLNHTRITLAQQEPSCRLRKPPSTHTKLEKDQTWVVAQPSLPQTTFSKLQTQAKSSKNWSKINLQ